MVGVVRVIDGGEASRQVEAVELAFAFRQFITVVVVVQQGVEVLPFNGELHTSLVQALRPFRTDQVGNRVVGGSEVVDLQDFLSRVVTPVTIGCFGRIPRSHAIRFEDPFGLIEQFIGFFNVEGVVDEFFFDSRRLGGVHPLRQTIFAINQGTITAKDVDEEGVTVNEVGQGLTDFVVRGRTEVVGKRDHPVTVTFVGNVVSLVGIFGFFDLGTLDNASNQVDVPGDNQVNVGGLVNVLDDDGRNLGFFATVITGVIRVVLQGHDVVFERFKGERSGDNGRSKTFFGSDVFSSGGEIAFQAGTVSADGDAIAPDMERSRTERSIGNFIEVRQEFGSNGHGEFSVADVFNTFERIRSAFVVSGVANQRVAGGVGRAYFNPFRGSSKQDPEHEIFSGDFGAIRPFQPGLQGERIGLVTGIVNAGFD